MGFRNPITALSELVADVFQTAASGRRWVISSDPGNEIDGYTDHANETYPAALKVYTEDWSGGGYTGAFFDLLAPKLSTGTPAWIRLLSVWDNVLDTIGFSQVVLNAGTTQLKVIESTGVRIEAEAGIPPIPLYASGRISQGESPLVGRDWHDNVIPSNSPVAAGATKRVYDETFAVPDFARLAHVTFPTRASASANCAGTHRLYASVDGGVGFGIDVARTHNNAVVAKDLDCHLAGIVDVRDAASLRLWVDVVNDAGSGSAQTIHVTHVNVGWVDG